MQHLQYVYRGTQAKNCLKVEISFPVYFNDLNLFHTYLNSYISRCLLTTIYLLQSRVCIAQIVNYTYAQNNSVTVLPMKILLKVPFQFCQALLDLTNFCVLFGVYKLYRSFKKLRKRVTIWGTLPKEISEREFSTVVCIY